MTDGDTVRVVGNALLVVAMLGAIAMPIVYAVLAPWARTTTGRVLMALMIALPLILGSNILGIAYPGEVRQWLRLGVYAAVMLAIWGIVIALVRIQTQSSNHRNGDDHDGQR